MNMLITPHPLAGRIDPVMSSKSQAHRLLICAALADGPTELRNVGFSADVEATLRCLRALGTQIETDADTLRIVPVAHIQKGALLDCGESGSTLRFLLPVVGVPWRRMCLYRPGQAQTAASVPAL